MSAAGDEWLARQFSGASTITGVLESAGWIHTAGGTGPYLALRARLATVRRGQIDDAVYRKLDVLELPSVRESTMLVPRADAAIALAAGRRAFQHRLSKLPVERREIERLADRVMKTLGEGIRKPDSLRAEIPSSFIRSLGDEGKKIGYASTLPIALRLLQVEGRVFRVAEGFQLDANAFLYRRWPDSVALGKPPEDLDVALAERFVRWAAPVTVDDFAFWAGIGNSAAKKALAQIPPIAVPSADPPGVVLLPFRDNYFSLHHGQIESIQHNGIVARGELRGIWEFDPHDERIAWRLFAKTRGVEAAVRETETYIREELGDHKFYPFDHGRTRERRLASVRG